MKRLQLSSQLSLQPFVFIIISVFWNISIHLRSIEHHPIELNFSDQKRHGTAFEVDIHDLHPPTIRSFFSSVPFRFLNFLWAKTKFCFPTLFSSPLELLPRGCDWIYLLITPILFLSTYIRLLARSHGRHHHHRTEESWTREREGERKREQEKEVFTDTHSLNWLHCLVYLWLKSFGNQ